jgi:hypothetical protein
MEDETYCSKDRNSVCASWPNGFENGREICEYCGFPIRKEKHREESETSHYRCEG